MAAEEKVVEVVREALREARLDELAQIKNLISIHRFDNGDAPAELPITRAVWTHLLAREKAIKEAR